MINDFQKNIEAVNTARNESLRKKFGVFMKQNTLIRLKEEIKNSTEFKSLLFKCYNFQTDPIVALGVDDIDYDICANLAVNFWYENLFESNETKSKRLKDRSYTDYIKSRTILQCKLRRLKEQYRKSNDFLSHTSLNYSLHCVVNYILSALDNNIKNKIRPSGINGNFKINTLFVLLTNIKSILLLTESNDFGSAFSLLRSLIEMTCVYFAVGDNEKVATEYYKFMQFRIDFDANGTFPNEFIENAPKDCSWHNHINYGWFDLLDNKKHKYIFSELIEYAKMDNMTLRDQFLDYYKYCCKFSHGNYITQSIGEYDFIWILGRVGLILIELANNYEKLFDDKINYDGVNLIDWLEITTRESLEIYQRQLQNNL